jgi:aminopeptidase YwaD
MKRGHAIFAIAGTFMFAFSLLSPLGAQADPPDDATDWLEVISEHMDSEYVQGVVEDVVAIGSCDLGFRVAGTAAEHETVDYIVDEMNAIGLMGVGTEPVSVDAWEFRSASLKVDSPVEMEIQASSFGCVQGTDGPISGEMVYVGSSYASDYEVAGDVEGKIVFTNWDGYNVWIDAIGMMAYLHGAKAIVVSNMDSMYAQGDYALHCQDASWDTGVWPPAIYIPKEYGFELLELIEGGETLTVTVESDIEVDLDATGYNTIGYIPGKNYGTPDDRLLIVGDHHDAWFTGAADDTSAIGLTLGMAKAIIDSGYEPENTLVFTTHTAEEYGTTNVYFDWCVGAWYQITREHPEWAGKAIAYINLEMQGIKEAEFSIQTPVDLYPFMCEVAEKHSDRMPFGVSVNYDITCWNDGFTFTAEGVPGITTASVHEEGELCMDNIYHTQLDCVDILDFDYLGDGCLFMNLAMTIELDQMEVIPYSFDARAAHFAESWIAGKALGVGADAELVIAVDAAAAEFATLAGEWATAKDSVPPGKIGKVNQLLLDTIKVVEDGFTAMEVWELTVYPHEQGLRDAFWIDVCIDRLSKENPAAAKSVIKNLKWWVGTVWYYDFMPFEYYIYDAIALHSLDNWGEQTQLGEIVDTWRVIESLEEKIVTGDSDFSQEIEWLEEEREVAIQNLENGMETLLTTFTDANALLSDLV